MQTDVLTKEEYELIIYYYQQKMNRIQISELLNLEIETVNTVLLALGAKFY